MRRIGRCKSGMTMPWRQCPSMVYCVSTWRGLSCSFAICESWPRCYDYGLL